MRYARAVFGDPVQPSHRIRPVKHLGHADQPDMLVQQCRAPMLPGPPLDPPRKTLQALGLQTVDRRIGSTSQGGTQDAGQPRQGGV